MLINQQPAPSESALIYRILSSISKCRLSNSTAKFRSEELCPVLCKLVLAGVVEVDLVQPVAAAAVAVHTGTIQANLFQRVNQLQVGTDGYETAQQIGQLVHQGIRQFFPESGGNVLLLKGLVQPGSRNRSRCVSRH